MEKYYFIVLKFLSEQSEITDFNTVKIDGVEEGFLITVKNDLAKKGLINCGSGHSAWINQDGKDYLKKLEFGIRESNPIVHIGHNINAPVSQSNFSNSGDNSFYKQTTERKIEANNPKRSKIEKLYWIVGIIVGLTIVYEFLHKSTFP